MHSVLYKLSSSGFGIKYFRILIFRIIEKPFASSFLATNMCVSYYNSRLYLQTITVMDEAVTPDKASVMTIHKVSSISEAKIIPLQFYM